ncbi:flagella basal body P-ring formation protein FlgA [Rhodococcus sp. SRB_17]|nr:flagella basal body P-ring formation protein FlgA [Acidovorax sp. SRB_24]NMM76390.1 flagella basal body P-ring formation protein FlgA [Acidovorax sp. SRB_24]NMM84870.1 flagella basal body P-ring formation protein FlgA [Rhodococcus sp. SRB_17]
MSQAASPEPAVQVEAAVRQFLAEQATLKGLVDPAFELSFVSRAPVPAPCPQAVAVDAMETRYLSRMRFSATCPGQAGWQRDWIVRAEVSAMVVVAATDVPANRPLAEADLTQERRKLADMADSLPALDAAIGQASARALRAGQVVQPRFLAQPVLVKRGDSVHIVARSGPVEVQVAGEALESGRRGAIVRVRNTSTGKIIRARVLDSAVVEPESMAGSYSGQSND